jgi:GH43 family beta-xylosidase
LGRNVKRALVTSLLGLALALPLAGTSRSAEPAAMSSPAPRGSEAALVHAVAAAIRDDPVLTAPLRGSVTLPGKGSDIESVASLAGAERATITWRSSNRAVISDADRRRGADVVARGSVTRGPRDVSVRLTATVAAPGARAVSIPLDVKVLAKPAAAPKEAYLFTYFAGDSVDGEKLRFAVSRGNNALQWQNLNEARPVLESTFGTRGLRDPFIMRSAEGDRFFLLATDLSTGRTGWGKATDEGSHYLEIWESTDLVNWGNQRHVKVSKPNAGMTWAPEATYDPTIDAYVVYWTSHLFHDDARTSKDDNGPQILFATTRDFRTFSEPTPWFKSADLPDLVKRAGMIDFTVIKDGDYYYRFTKVTDAAGCPSADIMGQRSTSLRATTASGAWSVVDRCIGRRSGTPQVEGPSAFIANPGDASGFKYFLWVDHYTGVGYIPLATHSLQAPIQWTYPKDFLLPVRPRHGSLLGITAAERDAVIARWGASPITTPEQAAEAWAIPPVVASGTRPPAPIGYRATWSAEGPGLTNGVLTNEGETPITVRLTGTMPLPAGGTLTKRFEVQVLGKNARRLAAYARTPTNAHDANQPVIARSVHLALGLSDADLKPLNDNYGVLFAGGDHTGVDRVAQRGVADPSLFYFTDGSLGVIAGRVEMSGAADASQASSALVFKADPKSPADFVELGLVDLRTVDGVVRPRAVWDQSAGRYLVSWRDKAGAAHWTTVTDLARTEAVPTPFAPENGGRRSRVVSVGNVGETRSGELATLDAGVSDTARSRLPGAEAASGLPVSGAVAAALETRFGRIVNTGVSVEPTSIRRGDLAPVLAARARLAYSDGSVATRAVDWNAADLARLKAARSGVVEIHGTVRAPAYPKVFAYNRADPTIYRYERGGKVRYLFIATDDTNNNNVGSPHLPIRVADSIEALADDKGGKAREVDLLNRLQRRDRTVEGKVIAGCYWAPELHEIGGKLSILFAPCFNLADDQSNETGSWSTVQSHIMQLRDGGDPANPADWSRPAAILKADGSALGRPEFPRNISLDMSYFEAGGRSYYTWSQRYIGTPNGDPLTWIARVDPAHPTRLISEPKPIIAPSLTFEENLSEGAFAQIHDGRVHLIYSSSGVSPTYVVGGVWAQEGSDLSDIDSWTKWTAPLQKSVPMPEGVTDYLAYEQGPGHGAFTTDADGNALYVYHTWGNGVGGNGRDTRLRRVHWARDGRPVLDMSPDEEVARNNRSVTMTVTVGRPAR